MAEWSYDRVENQGEMQHAPVDAAYSWYTNLHSSSYYYGHIYYVTMDIDDKPLASVEVRVYPGAYGPYTGLYGIAVTSMTLEAGSALSIENAKADPEEFAPGADPPDNETKITAQIVVEEGTSLNSIQWQVTIKDSAENTVKTFEQRSGASGTGPWDVEETWDGKIGDEEYVPDGEYAFVIKATATSGSETLEAETTGTIQVGGLVIEIYDEDENLIASSEDKYPEISWTPPTFPDEIAVTAFLQSQRQTQTTEEYELGRKNHIIPRKANDPSRDLTIVLKKGPSDDTVDITWELLKFDKTITTTLTKTSDRPREHKGRFPIEKMTVYTHSFTWYDSTSVNNLYPPTSGLRDSFEFILGEQSRGFTEYLGGVYNFTDLLTDEDAQLFFVQPTKEALQYGGFETWFGKYRDSNGKEKKISLHIQNQARELYYSGHGYHDEAKVWIKDKEWMLPEEIPSNSWRDNLDIIILAACSVLDIGDFNNNYDSSGSAHRANPGLKWFNLVKDSPLNHCLLGYNYFAPPLPYDINVVSKYFQCLNQGITSIELSGHIEPIAWVKANAEECDYDTACAITDEYYYFMYYTLGFKQKQWWHKNRRMYAIKRRVWERAGGPPPTFGGVSNNDKVYLKKYKFPDTPSIIH